ncbi:MAG: maltose alpha-D-glucosyltransferase, partial [Methanobacteriota archaeon]
MMMGQNKVTRKEHLKDDPLWYKDAIIYELHVRSFHDSDGNGIGDFRGLIEKLDYLEDLGITAIWLLPFYPSPLKDDGYDISDFFGVNTDYGNLHEFRDFLKEAHQRGIRVITELVLNHTSDQHSWFQMPRKTKPKSKLRNFYVWNNTTEKFKDARIIFKDFENSNWKWDPSGNAYFWHRFYSHQPDLNYDSPDVQKAMFRVIEFWLGLGVDGLRLDAVPYLYEREGTNCENLPETHAFLKKMRAAIDNKFKARMLLAEANQWPEDAAAYYGNGDEVQMCFHFPLMPRIFMAVQMEDRFPIIDIFEQTPSIPESCQWALFLRNHDELTLEMVADEERDYMYRAFAKDPRVRINLGIRRRLAPLLDNDRRKIELMNILLFSFPGTPVLYYGDEIGMGDNYYLGDRNGVRTPMQWSSDRNAGFSTVNPQRLYLPVIIDPEYHYEVVNVENENGNPSSLLWWMKRLIALRKSFKAFSRGSLEFLFPDNSKVLAFTRKYQDEIILVVVNLSRLSQAVELDLAKLAGFIPTEVFGKNKFPIIRDSPYVLTLAPYDFYIFSLQKEEEPVGVVKEKVLPEINVWPDWTNLLEEVQIEELDLLPNYLQGCRWFGGKARNIQKIRVLDDVPIPGKTSTAHLFMLEVNYVEGLSEIYSMPLSIATKEDAQRIIKEFPQSAVARLRFGDQEGILYDSAHDKEFRESLLSMIVRRKRTKGKVGNVVAYPSRTFQSLLNDKGIDLASEVLKGEQSNTSVQYENTFIFKLFRRLDVGMNPDLEIERFLTEKTDFTHIPPFAGGIEYRQANSEPMVVGFLQGFVPNQGDAWKYTLGVVDQY